MEKINKLLDSANQRLKQSNTGIRIFKRGQKLSLRGMLPSKSKDGKSSQQTLSLGIYCNPAGIQSAEKQAQKLASQLVFKEFSWDNWGDENQNTESIGYWADKCELPDVHRYAIERWLLSLGGAV